ncbi:MAG: glycosyltransferase family 87 protein [Isosphaeraceae bacterium]
MSAYRFRLGQGKSEAMGGDEVDKKWAGRSLVLDTTGREPVGLSLPTAKVRFRYVAVVLVVGLTVWGWLDVRERGQTHPDHLDYHRTDFTVYTAAGAAFFGGRDPYQVASPRGWHYLYPPLFALLVSPLAALDFKSQVVVWYIISIVLAFGCYSEARRLWTLLVASYSCAADVGRNAGFRIGVCAGLTVLLPTLECLQRGQVGIALLYPLLLGFRLTLGGRSWPIWFLGGVVLGWPIVVKLIPALPVAVLLLQHWAASLAPSRSPRSLIRATTVTLGLAVGMFLFTFAIPAACIGWSENLSHLRTWSRKVASSPDVGREVRFEVDDSSNQSFSNAAHLLAARIRGRATAGAHPETDQAAHEEWLAVVTATAEHRRTDYVTAEWVRCVEAIVLVLLIVTGLTAGLRGDVLAQAATYGLACLATVFISPVAWSHYYVLWLPSVLLVPPWLMRQGRLKAARVVAAVPFGLIWAHYLAKPWLGHFGFLGLGTLAWFLAVVTLSILIRGSYTSPYLYGRRTTASCHLFQRRNDQITIRSTSSRSI